jgi:hypothetical protein
MVAVTEDIRDLVEICKLVSDSDAKATLVEKILVDLKSFDDLAEELRTTLYKAPGPELPLPVVSELKDALRVYDKAIDGSRELLAKIRHNLGAHRRGLPGADERKRFELDFKAWGEWEQTLRDLEASCTLDRWIAEINAAICLRNSVTELGLGAWFSFEGGEFRPCFPVRLADDDSEPAG